MDFKLTASEVFIPEISDLSRLQKILDQKSEEINFSFGKFWYTSRVFYRVSDSITTDSTRIYIGFQSKHKKGNPGKYGDKFREDCLMFALDKANEMLNKSRKELILEIGEDLKIIAKRCYKREEEFENGKCK